MRKVIAAVLMLWPVAAHAHISIMPNESTGGATEKYTVRVPSDGKVATLAAELDVPEGVTIETLAVPSGWTYEVKRQDGRITGIVWQMTIKPGEFAEFSFIARNPRDKTQIVWPLRQKFADGTTLDGTIGPNGVARPAAITKLAPGPLPAPIIMSR